MVKSFIECTYPKPIFLYKDFIKVKKRTIAVELHLKLKEFPFKRGRECCVSVNKPSKRLLMTYLLKYLGKSSSTPLQNIMISNFGEGLYL